MDDDTQKKLASLIDIVKAMVDNIVDAIPIYAFSPSQRAQLKTTLRKLGAAEAIQEMTKHTIPSISWNHAKILAVHGKTMMTGGVNYWHEYGDNQNHINDISATLRGDATISAHKYCNYFWKFVFHASLLHCTDPN
jgi:phosphatidylserine/phosphatidylglycerophosphate/cardiolipin synthase-like enzyme